MRIASGQGASSAVTTPNADQTQRRPPPAAVRPQVGQDPPEVAEERPGVRGFAVARGTSSLLHPGVEQPQPAQRAPAGGHPVAAPRRCPRARPARRPRPSRTPTPRADQHRQRRAVTASAGHRLAGPGEQAASSARPTAVRITGAGTTGQIRQRSSWSPRPCSSTATSMRAPPAAPPADLQVPAVVGAAADDAGAAATGGGLDPADPLLGRLPALEPAGDPAPARQRACRSCGCGARAPAPATAGRPAAPPAGPGAAPPPAPAAPRRAPRAVRTQVRAGTGACRRQRGGHAACRDGQQRREHDRAAPHPRHQRQRRRARPARMYHSGVRASSASTLSAASSGWKAPVPQVPW